MKERGFSVTNATQKKHLKYKITAPNGQGIVWVLGATPSDRRAWLNATQTLRQWLSACGYPDERRYLRIVNTGPQEQFARQFHEILDEIGITSEIHGT
jgi:hypothetical protein